MSVPMLMSRAVEAAGAVRSGTAKLALLFIRDMLMFFVRTVDAAAAKRRGTAIPAFTHARCGYLNLRGQ